MVGITKGSGPITGVYVRTRMATGVYKGLNKMWPPPQPGEFTVSHGTFRFASVGLLAETGNTIRINPSSLDFAGRALSFASSTAAAADLLPGSLSIAPHQPATSAGAQLHLGAGALGFTAAQIASSYGSALSFGASALALFPMPLDFGAGVSRLIQVPAGAISLAPATLSATTGAAAQTSVGVGAVAFSGAALLPSTTSGVALQLTPSVLALSGAPLESSSGVTPAMGRSALGFQGAVLEPPTGLAVSIGAGAVAVQGAALVLPSAPTSSWEPLTFDSAGFQKKMVFSATRAVTFSNAGTVFAYTTSDAGQTWTTATLPQTQLYAGGLVFSATRGIALAYNNSHSFLTTDGGDTWTQLNALVTGTWNGGIVFDANHATVFANGTQNYRTLDSGASWLNSTLSGTFVAGVAFTSTNGVVIGDVSTSFNTTDAGSSWAASSLPAGAYLCVIRFSATTAVALASNGTSYRTTDAGATWVAVASLPTNETLEDAANFGATVGVVVGFNAANYMTYDAGATWFRMTDLAAGPLECVIAFDATHGVAGARNGTSYITTSLFPPTLGVRVTTSLPAADVGDTYTGSVTAANVAGATGSITITVDQLPAGLALGTRVDNGDGTFTSPVTGTLTTAQTVNSTFNATNGTQTGTLAHEFDIAAAMSLTGTLPNGPMGVAWTGVLDIEGGFTAPVTADVSVGTLPAWIDSVVVDTTAKTVTYSGMPHTAATYAFTPRITDSTTPTARTATDAQSITIATAPDVTLSGSFPMPTVGKPYTGSVTGTNINGATGTITYSVDVLPDGLALDTASGAITGTPTTVQTLDSHFTATNGTQGNTLTRSFIVAPAGISVVQTASADIFGKFASNGVSVTFSKTATLGNLLVAYVAAGQRSEAVTTPGWTPLFDLGIYGAMAFRISDGTEAGVSFNGASVEPAARVFEWAGAMPGPAAPTKDLTSPSVGGGTSVITWGPTDAPGTADSVPLVFLYTPFNDANAIWTPASPWSGQMDRVPGTAAFYRPAPNSAVSGSVSTGVEISSFGGEGSSSAWACLWLDPAVPSVRMYDHGLPTSASAGTAYSGSVTANNVGGADGEITISVDALPDGLALGATTGTGAGPYIATITGTPASAQTVSSTFTASNGTQSATVVHEFSVAGSAATSIGAGALAFTGAALDENIVASPAIALAATFPSSPHVGDSVNFDVTATLVFGATGTPTITVDQLPAGLSLGSTSMVDATHYKATVSGTLTTAQGITSTFGTTGGSPNATPLAHTFNVAAAATSATFVGANTFKSTSGNAPLPPGGQSGDWLFIAPTTNAVVTLSAPASPYAIPVIGDFNYTPSGNNRHLAVWAYKLTATDITNGYVAITTNAGRSQLIVARSSQATNPVDVSNTAIAAATTPSSVTVGSITTTVDGALLLLIDVMSGTSTTGTLGVAGFTVAQSMNDGTYHGGAAYLAQGAHGATGSVTAIFNNSASGASAAALIAVKP